MYTHGTVGSSCCRSDVADLMYVYIYMLYMYIVMACTLNTKFLGKGFSHHTCTLGSAIYNVHVHVYPLPPVQYRASSDSVWVGRWGGGRGQLRRV